MTRVPGRDGHPSGPASHERVTPNERSSGTSGSSSFALMLAKTSSTRQQGATAPPTRGPWIPLSRLLRGGWRHRQGRRRRTRAPTTRVLGTLSALQSPPCRRSGDWSSGTERSPRTRLPEVPPVRWPWQAPATLLDLPAGATALDGALTPDDTATVFGLDHTDSNQHVNSLVYPRLLVEATLRRLVQQIDDLTLRRRAAGRRRRCGHDRGQGRHARARRPRRRRCRGMVRRRARLDARR